MKRKKTDTVQLSKIRMREELRQKLARDAERNAKTLNGEIVDRLENSYEADERVKALREQANDLRRSLEEGRAQLETDRNELKAETAELRQLIVEQNKDLEELRRTTGEIERPAALLDILLGENRASREILRDIALLLANNPDWADTKSGVEQMAGKVGEAFQNRQSQ
jgi:chromosome segregation ATPase